MHRLLMAVALVGSGLLASAAAGHAQQLLLHFPLDGSPQSFGPGAADAAVYVAVDGTPPATVPGKFGQALRFDGTASIAMPFSLDAQAYPAVTVTAWVKLDADSKGQRTVFSAGNGSVPRLEVYGDRANFIAARSALMFNKPMPRDEWAFVAGVVDVASAQSSVHQGDEQLARDGINAAKLYPPSSYRNPDDPSLPATRYVFIGSHGFKQWPARQMAIDDVRVYVGALSAEQLAALRTSSAVETYAATPGSAGGATTGGTAGFSGGVLTDENVADLGRAREGRQPVDITYASEEEALAAAERREREAGQEELNRQQNELEAQRRAETDAASPTDTGNAPAAKPAPVGEPSYTAVAGQTGQNMQVLDLVDRFFDEIHWEEGLDMPCVIRINGGNGPARQLNVGCFSRGGDTSTVRLDGAIIGSISVCSSGARNGRLKGIKLNGSRLGDDGSLSFVPASAQAYRPNCETWSPLQLCPINPDQMATGVVVHSNQASGSFWTNDSNDREIVGLQLVCRQVGVK